MKLVIAVAAVLLSCGAAFADKNIDDDRREPPPQTRVDDEPPNPCAKGEYCGLVCRKIVHPRYRGTPWAVQIRKCMGGRCPVVSIVAVSAGQSSVWACGKPDQQACVNWRTDDGKPKYMLWYFGSVPEVADRVAPASYRESAYVPPPRVRTVIKYRTVYASASSRGFNREERRETPSEVDSRWNQKPTQLRRGAPLEAARI